MSVEKELVTIACCQYGPQVGAIEYNRKRSEEMIRRAAKKGGEIILLPELAQSGFNFTSQEEAYQLSETLDGATLSLWRDLAIELNIVLVAGFCERLPNQCVANSSILIEPDGAMTPYRKVHLWDNEINIFIRGEEQPPVVETIYGHLGMMICYDIEFPEWVRIPALAGAEILCAPVNWPQYPRPKGERPTEMIRAQANASVNKLFMAVCDRSDRERGVDWVGGSLITDSDGFPITDAFGQGEQILVATVNLSEARDKRISPNNDVHKDRQPHLYHSLIL